VQQQFTVGGVTGGLGWSQAQMMFDNVRDILGVER